MVTLPVIACHECDLLQRKIALPPRGRARCRRCRAILYRDYPPGSDRALACTIAALMLFLIANAYPIVGLEVQGNRQTASLYDAVRTLWVEGREDVALLVGFTAMLTPAIEISLLIYLLLPLKFNRVTENTVPILRFLQTVRPWSMTEVFVLGVLVAFVKLEHLARVEAGIALWAFGGLIPLLIIASASFDPEELWAKATG
ncbi:MAG: Paraquat-inducible protein A [Nitrospira sp.]|jgi:paraquat-inducible protein A|nr:MAG: Paraquat-inducible protein A [Nitrospira sp.]